MSVEADTIARKLEAVESERRERRERRGRDRRRAGSRINMDAPRASWMKIIGAYGVALSTAAFALTLVAGQVLGTSAAVVVIGFEAAAMITSVLLLALGSIELRLIEIRLELMMLNGGMRNEDRRSGDRRAEAA